MDVSPWLGATSTSAPVGMSKNREMETQSGPGIPSGPVLPKSEVKLDSDTHPTPALTAVQSSVRIKKEEPEMESIVRGLSEGEDGNDMFDDVDDVNGPEYVDLTYEGIAEVDGVDCFVCEEFKIRQIPKPIIVKRPLDQLFECIESKHIVLDPNYQREVVWDEGRAALLINSILMGYFIPPIIFNCVQQEGQFKRICVDGKQRLTSVRKFMTGQIGFLDSNTPQKKWFFCHLTIDGQTTPTNRNILPKAVREFFKTQVFCCYEYENLTVAIEENMFQLVQRGVALTPAEKMRAMSTEWAIFTKQYEDDYSLVVNLSKQNRASGFRLVLTIFTMIQEVMTPRKKRSTAPVLQASPQALARVLDDKAGISSGLKSMFKSIFDRFEALVKMSSTVIAPNQFKINRNSAFEPAPDYLRAEEVDHVRTFSPLELIATAILISTYMNTRTNEELLTDIKDMRYYLRIEHRDLRVNAQCWVTVWEFITKELPRRHGGDSLSAEGSSAERSLVPKRLAAAGISRSSTPVEISVAGVSINGAPNGVSSKGSRKLKPAKNGIVNGATIKEARARKSPATKKKSVDSGAVNEGSAKEPSTETSASKGKSKMRSFRSGATKDSGDNGTHISPKVMKGSAARASRTEAQEAISSSTTPNVDSSTQKGAVPAAWARIESTRTKALRAKTSVAASDTSEKSSSSKRMRSAQNGAPIAKRAKKAS